MINFEPKYKIARFGLHHYEEPVISGTCGSGTVFFSGCALKCCFCQNYELSHDNRGIVIDESQLLDVFRHLQDEGAHNINLVTPSHYAKCLALTLNKAKSFLKIPIVYNTGSYESVENLKLLSGLIDIYLPDLKYYDDALAVKFSNAKNYFDLATRAITQMRLDQPMDKFDENGMMTNGVLVRHLVLPGQIEDSKKVLDWLSEFDRDIMVSLMCQYFPPLALPKPLDRRLTKGEYNKIVEYMENVGLHNGYTQELSSATAEYTPNFDLNQLQRQLEELKKKNSIN